MAQLRKDSSNTNFVSIKNLLDNKQLTIPYYQRNYSWNKDNINSILDSLEFLYNEPDLNDSDYMNYLGPIVLLTENNKTKQIIDGQQRLTTIFLILAYIKNQLLSFRSILSSDAWVQIQDDVNDYIREYENILFLDKKKTNLFSHVKSENKIHLKHHNKNDKNDFSKILEGKPDEINKIRKNSIIKRNYNNIDNYFNVKKSELHIKEDDIGALCSMLIKYADALILSTYVLNIEITDMSNAFSIFETMNNTGMSLKPFDLINGYIQNEFEKLKSDYDQEVKSKYNEIINKIHEENNGLSNKYAFHWMNSINNNDTSNSELFSEVKKYIGNGNDGNFSKKVLEMVNSFNELNQYLKLNTNSTAKLINWLKRVKILPLFLLLKRSNYNEEEIDDIILGMIKYSIVELNLLGKSPGNFQYRIKEVMKFVSDSEKKETFKSISENNINVKRDLTNHKDLDIFERILNFEILDHNLNKSLLLLLLITKIENHTTFNWDKIDGEHAFAQNPKSGELSTPNWVAIKDDKETIAKYRDCLGNARLMNKQTNILASNNSGEIKATIIVDKSKNTDPLTSNSFNVIDYNVLSPEYIEKRHKEIIDKMKEEKIFELI
ncbi:DUF262 domain-containing protein [Mesoplasma corruscae]|uniref:GmrSD restriction endonucleases N-terminal domain-containing protein n=1 Tax=Mesoplasma corruscae TaxID=216874 RepID=A0A2S5RGB6_9MOLU|nr:DUF262 domain-containing protein [Mesoplasma corruscae]PPE06379.1 hypothetical protein MCORR_v1c00070 [Mesoplasma corruscae]